MNDHALTHSSDSTHRAQAETFAHAAEAALTEDPTKAATLAKLAETHAALAVAHESRTVAIGAYFQTLVPGTAHHEQQEAAAVLALLRTRLGLNT